MYYGHRDYVIWGITFTLHVLLTQGLRDLVPLPMGVRAQ